MKKGSGSKIKLGLFISIGIMFFIVAIYMIGSKKNMFSKNFKVSAFFKTVSGLQAGSNVRFSGIVVGTVDNIQIVNDTSVRVDFLIKEEVHKFIKTDSRASIGTDGLMGYKLVNISHGSTDASEVRNNGYILSSPPIDFEAILKDVKVTTENVKHITTDLADITHSLHSGKGTLGRLIRDSTLAGNFEGTAKNLEKGSMQLNEHMEALKHNFLFKGYYKKKEKEKEEALEKKRRAEAGEDTTEKKKRRFLFFKRKDKDNEEEDD